MWARVAGSEGAPRRSSSKRRVIYLPETHRDAWFLPSRSARRRPRRRRRCGSPIVPDGISSLVGDRLVALVARDRSRWRMSWHGPGRVGAAPRAPRRPPRSSLGSLDDSSSVGQHSSAGTSRRAGTIRSRQRRRVRCSDPGPERGVVAQAVEPGAGVDAREDVLEDVLGVLVAGPAKLSHGGRVDLVLRE